MSTIYLACQIANQQREGEFFPSRSQVYFNSFATIKYLHPGFYNSEDMATKAPEPSEAISITPLLKSLAYPATSEVRASAEDIASAFALIFENRLSTVQTAALLTLLHSTQKDKDPAVLAKCASQMTQAGCQVEKGALKKLIRSRRRREGVYRGGLVSGIESCCFLSL